MREFELYTRILNPTFESASQTCMEEVKADHSVKLIAQEIIEPIQYTKVKLLHGHNPRLHTDEVLVALSMLSLTDEKCRRALATLPQLNGCQVHATVMLSEVDHKIFKKLGIGLTSDPLQKSVTRRTAGSEY